MDAHFKRIFDELKQMELWLSDRIEGHCRALERRIEGPVFDTELAVDDGLIFDEGPLFDEELIFDKESILDLKPAAAASSLDLDFAPNNFHNGTPANCSTNCAGYFFDSWKPAVFDEEPIDEEPTLDLNSVAAAAASDIDIMEFSNFNSGTPTKCSTKCPNSMVNVMASSMVHTVTEEVCDSTATPMVMLHDVLTSSDKCQYDEEAVYGAKSGFPLVSTKVSMNTSGMVKCTDSSLLEQFWPPNLSLLTVSKKVTEVHYFVLVPASVNGYIDLQPWPPPILLEILHDSAEARPMPWPSFISSNCSMSWDVRLIWKRPWPSVQPQHNIRSARLVWKPPWSLHHQQNIRCVPATEFTEFVEYCAIIGQLVQWKCVFSCIFPVSWCNRISSWCESRWHKYWSSELLHCKHWKICERERIKLWDPGSCCKVWEAMSADRLAYVVSFLPEAISGKMLGIQDAHWQHHGKEHLNSVTLPISLFWVLCFRFSCCKQTRGKCYSCQLLVRGRTQVTANEIIQSSLELELLENATAVSMCPVQAPVTMQSMVEPVLKDFLLIHEFSATFPSVMSVIIVADSLTYALDKYNLLEGLEMMYRISGLMFQLGDIVLVLQFIQNFSEVFSLHVLCPAELKIQLPYWVFSISTSTWFRFRAIFMAFGLGLKLRARSYSGFDQFASDRSERQQGPEMSNTAGCYFQVQVVLIHCVEHLLLGKLLQDPGLALVSCERNRSVVDGLATYTFTATLPEVRLPTMCVDCKSISKVKTDSSKWVSSCDASRTKSVLLKLLYIRLRTSRMVRRGEC